MSITDKLRGISPDLDRMPEQTRTKPEAVTSAFIENVQREIYNRKQ